jgi:molybdate transport system ATP-binding protein
MNPDADLIHDVGLKVDITTDAGSFSVSASFTASAGITALYGPSGSGKSVTLATIAGLLRPEQGVITYDGRVLADAGRGVHVRTQERRVGMVFQHAALLPHRSPVDNVALGVMAGTRAQRRDIATELLNRVHAGHLATSPTRTLSGGEQQRVALARALAGDVKLLLLDEPFSALDQPTRVALRAMVRELVDAHGLTAVLVTHDQVDIEELADRVVLYEPGRTIGMREHGPWA